MQRKECGKTGGGENSTLDDPDEVIARERNSLTLSLLVPLALLVSC